MMRYVRSAVTRLSVVASLSAVLTGGVVGHAHAEPVVFLSTQLTPSAETVKMREDILNDFPGEVFFEPSDNNLNLRQVLGKDGVTLPAGLLGGTHGELMSLAAQQVLSDVGAAVPLAQRRGMAQSFIDLGKVGGDVQRYIPWMQATYLMAADRRALAYLPKGADLNALTYEQLIAWGANVEAAVGEPKIGLPVGGGGLIHRFVQGYLYPSYTGGTVRGFNSPEALNMWDMMRRLWKHVSPRSLGFASMDAPLMSGEVWIAWDHSARLKKALDDEPDRFIAFPAPSGPKGRGFMAVIAGLSIPKDAPQHDASMALLDYLTAPTTQATTMRAVGFFPVVNLGANETLPAGLKLLSEGVTTQSSAPDALPVLLPIGLGEKGGAFNSVYSTAFSRIVMRGKDPKKILAQQTEILKTIFAETGAPCWAPDALSEGPCPVD